MAKLRGGNEKKDEKKVTFAREREHRALVGILGAKGRRVTHSGIIKSYLSKKRAVSLEQDIRTLWVRVA